MEGSWLTFLEFQPEEAEGLSTGSSQLPLGAGMQLVAGPSGRGTAGQREAQPQPGCQGEHHPNPGVSHSHRLRSVYLQEGD